MQCKNLLNPGIIRAASTRFITSDVAKNTVEQVADKKLQYYQNLQQNKSVNITPPGWESALPFDAIPGPKPLPIVGNLWRFFPKIGDYYGQDIHEIFKKLHEEYGDIFILRGMPGQKSTVQLVNPVDFETFYKNDGAWPIRYGMDSFVHYRTNTRKNTDRGCGGVLSTQGEEWFKLRSAVNPIIMKPKNVLEYVDRMDKIADELIDNIRYLSTLNENGEMPENFLRELHKWGLESIGVLVLDRRLGTLKRDLAKDSEPMKLITSTLEIFELMYKLDVLPSWWRYLPTATWKHFVEVTDFITDTSRKYINEAMERIKKNPKLDDDDETSILEKMLLKDKNIAIGMAMDMMMAGIDTTGRVLGAGLYYLAKHHDKQDKLRQELIQLYPSNETPTTKETLAKSEYLKAVIKEITRLAPIGIGNLRTSQKDLVLSGYRVPKGTEIVTLNLLAATNDKNFPRPEEFLPERWLRNTKGDLSSKNVNKFVSLPFGFGPRSCIGQRIATLELEIALSKIIRNFKLDWKHPDMRFSTTILRGIADPLKLQVTPLKH